MTQVLHTHRLCDDFKISIGCSKGLSDRTSLNEICFSIYLWVCLKKIKNENCDLNLITFKFKRRWLKEGEKDNQVECKHIKWLILKWVWFSNKKRYQSMIKKGCASDTKMINEEDERHKQNTIKKCIDDVWPQMIQIFWNNWSKRWK